MNSFGIGEMISLVGNGEFEGGIIGQIRKFNWVCSWDIGIITKSRVKSFTKVFVKLFSVRGCGDNQFYTT